MNNNPEIQQYIQKKSCLQQALLDYLYSSEKIEENYQNLIRILEDQTIYQNKYDLIEFLHLISNISNNHCRTPTFFAKVGKVLIQYKKEIHDLLSNRAIFDIFKNNKRLLLFLFDEKMLVPDPYVCEIMLSKKYRKANYSAFFYPELKRHLKEKKEKEENKITPSQRLLAKARSNMRNKKADDGKLYKNDPETFEEKRKIGLNDTEPEILQLIRDDNIDNFISHVSKTDYNLKSCIENSIFETNSFLYDKKPSLIKYATFYGSIQIFKFLASKKEIKLTPSLWLYAIHGDHPEIFSILEEKKIEPVSYDKCYKEAVKCHHNDIARYIEEIKIRKEQEGQNDGQNEEENDGQNDDEKSDGQNKEEEENDDQNEEEEENDDQNYDGNDEEKASFILKYFNYSLFDFDFSDQKNLFYLCQFDYPSLFQIILKVQSIDVNSKIKFTTRKAKKIDPERKRRWYFSDRFDHDIYRFYLKEEEKTALTAAIESDSIGIVHLLMTIPNLDVNSNSTEKLWWRVEFEKLEKKDVDGYLQDKENDEWYKDENSTEDEEKKEKVTINSPLTLAISNENEEIVQLLMKKNEIDTNQKFVFKKWKWTSDEFRRYGNEKTNEEEKTPLFKAVEKENENIVKLLISDSKIDINALSIIRESYISTEKHVWKSWSSTDSEKSALHKASEKSNFEIVKLLVLDRKDIDINEKSITTKYDIYYESDHDDDVYQIHDWKIEEKIKEIEEDYKNNRNEKYDSNSYKKTVKIDEKTALDYATRKRNLSIINFLKKNKGIEINVISEEEIEREENEERMKDACNIC